MSSEIKKVAVIGTGVIGAGWITRCLAHNKKVVAFDKDYSLKKKLIIEIKLFDNFSYEKNYIESIHSDMADESLFEISNTSSSV